MNGALPPKQPTPSMPHQPPPVRKHSKLGMASLVIALGLPLLFFLVFWIVILLQVRIANEGFT